MTEPARDELERLRDAAASQGRPKTAAICQHALTYIDRLETEIRRRRGNPSLGGQTRRQNMTPDQRKAQARLAAQRRWQRPDA